MISLDFFKKKKKKKKKTFPFRCEISEMSAVSLIIIIKKKTYSIKATLLHEKDLPLHKNTFYTAEEVFPIAYMRLIV